MINVAIISPEKSMEPVDKVIKEHDFNCHFHKYIYNETSDIDNIYNDLKEKCDVIFFSGEIGYHYIKKKFPNIRIPCTFTAYEPIDVLSILLNFQIKHPEIKMNRVFCDFLTKTNNYMDVENYIEKDNLPYFYEDTHYDYRHITEYAKKLWDDGKIDCILSRSINNLKRLDLLKIPYFAVFPSEEMIVKSIRTALYELKIEEIEEKDEINILIRLPFGENMEEDEQEYREASIYKCLVDLRKEFHLDFSIRQGFNQFEIHKRCSVGKFTEDKARFYLEALKKEISFPFRIGIGISPGRERSRYFSEHALHESNKYGRNDAFMVSEEGKITGPISKDHHLIYKYSNKKAIEFSKREGINETNILKLISVFEQKPDIILSSKKLSQLLGITKRSASRILSNLESVNLLYIYDDIKDSKRQGRPSKYYKFNKENFKTELI